MKWTCKVWVYANSGVYLVKFEVESQTQPHPAQVLASIAQGGVPLISCQKQRSTKDNEFGLRWENIAYTLLNTDRIERIEFNAVNESE